MLTTFHNGSPTSGDDAGLDSHALLEAALAAREGCLTASGAFVVRTGSFTGRSPQDKYVVDEPGSRDAIWWGAVNQPMPETTFRRLLADVRSHLAGTSTWRQRLATGADPVYRYPVDLTTERAWVALFARHLFLAPEPGEEGTLPITILHAPGYQVDPARFGTRSATVIAIHPTRRIILIAGTEYAGEVKKAVFTLMQYLLPNRDVATMHCSATVDARGETTLFFGLSGTGKTTLSNDPRFRLVGDDEHGWSERGVFNVEGGCYAKTISLSARHEPGIFAAANRAGTVLENVVVDAAGVPDFDDDSLTENTRAAFPIDAIPNAIAAGTAPHPSRIVFLTADATGVLPPVAKLTPEQAMGLFLLGFTSKIPGTERGLVEPETTFSPAFGAPFLPLPPQRHAELLARKIDAHSPALWLVNTGWTGGSYTTGARIGIDQTRTIVNGIVDGTLERGGFSPESVFGLAVPDAVAGIPATALLPRQAWDDPDAYDRQAQRLREEFRATAEAMGIPPAWSAWLDRPNPVAVP